jgi:activator of HSP90 ATPase
MHPRNDSTPSISAPTRRQLLTALAATAGVMATGSALLGEPAAQNMQDVPGKAENEHRTSLHEEIEIKAPPQRIYEALLSSKTFTAFTGVPATIDPKMGGAFSMFGGQIVGRNVELVSFKLIVQAWRPTHWSAGVYSIAKFVLEDKAPSVTMVVLDHTGFPEGEFDHLEWGWHNHYWEPLKKYLA